MRTYHIAQGTPFKLCGDQPGNEIQKRRDVYIWKADSLCCTEIINTTL